MSRVKIIFVFILIAAFFLKDIRSDKIDDSRGFDNDQSAVDIHDLLQAARVPEFDLPEGDIIETDYFDFYGSVLKSNTARFNLDPHVPKIRSDVVFDGKRLELEELMDFSPGSEVRDVLSKLDYYDFKTQIINKDNTSEVLTDRIYADIEIGSGFSRYEIDSFFKQ